MIDMIRETGDKSVFLSGDSQKYDDILRAELELRSGISMIDFFAESKVFCVLNSHLLRDNV